VSKIVRIYLLVFLFLLLCCTPAPIYNTAKIDIIQNDISFEFEYKPEAFFAQGFIIYEIDYERSQGRIIFDTWLENDNESKIKKIFLYRLDKSDVLHEFLVNQPYEYILTGPPHHIDFVGNFIIRAKSNNNSREELNLENPSDYYIEFIDLR